MRVRLSPRAHVTQSRIKLQGITADLADVAHVGSLKTALDERPEAVVGWKGRDGYSVLHHVCDSPAPSLEAAKLLVDAGADVNGTSDQGSTPLHVCATGSAGHVAVARCLLANGADPSAKDAYGNIPLYYALTAPHAGDTDMISLLQENTRRFSTHEEVVVSRVPAHGCGQVRTSTLRSLASRLACCP